MQLREDSSLEEALGLFNTMPKTEKDRFIYFNNLYTTEFFVEDSVEVHLPNTSFNNICRYCSDGTNFDTIAHLIPESLGNKHIFSKDECDNCNSRFGKYYDSELAKFFHLSRVIGAINGKKGRPKYVDQITRIESKVSGRMKTLNLTTVLTEDDIVIGEQFSTVRVKFKSHAYNGKLVLRALAKIGLGLLNVDELDNYQWILRILNNHKLDIPIQIYPIFLWKLPTNISSSVQLMTLKRSNNNQYQVLPERILLINFADQFVQFPLFSDTDVAEIKRQAIYSTETSFYMPFAPMVASEQHFLEMGISIQDPIPIDLCDEKTKSREVFLEFTVDTNSLPDAFVS